MISADARVLRYLRWWRHSLVSCTTLATWEDDEDWSRVLDIGSLRLAGCSGAACGQISGGGDGAGGGEAGGRRRAGGDGVVQCARNCAKSARQEGRGG